MSAEVVICDSFFEWLFITRTKMDILIFIRTLGHKKFLAVFVSKCGRLNVLGSLILFGHMYVHF